MSRPSMEEWLEEAKKHEDAGKIGMYLTHNGIVRESAKAKVRFGREDAPAVKAMLFSYDRNRAEAYVQKTLGMEGIYYVKVWLNEGKLQVGDDIMQILIGGDIRPHVVDALNYLVGNLKDRCVSETELY